jgi:DNA-binding MarR family transcriptional regulator
MIQTPDSPLARLADEVSRTNGRLKSLFAEVRRLVELGDSELLVLSAVVSAQRAPTVPQIGRSLGHPRQLIQRAANSLVERGLLEAVANPDHKRAPLLAATPAGVALKVQADGYAQVIAGRFGAGLDMGVLTSAADALFAARQMLEQHGRNRES